MKTKLAIISFVITSYSIHYTKLYDFALSGTGLDGPGGPDRHSGHGVRRHRRRAGMALLALRAGRCQAAARRRLTPFDQRLRSTK